MVQSNGTGRRGAAATHDDPHAIPVRCPNPDCGKAYTANARYAGRRGKCPACGSDVAVPAAPPPAPSQRADLGNPPTPRRATIDEVRVGCIGRGNAGKTALFHALAEGVVGDALPSGLHVDAADPREVARLIRDAEATQRLLQQSGLPPTLKVSETLYRVYDGDAGHVAYRMREVIGQILTHTLPDSATELQARYDEYLHTLVDAHVLWAVVPCPPPTPGPRDRRRYANDLRITAAYLREALRLRPDGEPPAAVAIVLSKIDTLFTDAAAARAALPEATLRDALAPLVNLVANSSRVSDAAVIPVTAFGFGNAVLADGPGGRTPASGDEPFGAEPVWLLPDGASPRPYNLDALFLWTVLLGLYVQSGRDAEAAPEVRGVYRRLSSDLRAADPWLLPVKGTGTTAEPAETA